MGMTQPTISRRLQLLERSLGLRLLQRTTHSMRLTMDGERCYARAKVLLDSWACFESELRGASDEPEGMLRVVVPHAFGQERLVKPLAEYLNRHPRMTGPDGLVARTRRVEGTDLAELLSLAGSDGILFGPLPVPGDAGAFGLQLVAGGQDVVHLEAEVVDAAVRLINDKGYALPN